MMEEFQRGYAIPKSKTKAVEVLKALAHTNCDQKSRIARGLRVLLRIEVETSAVIPPHAKEIIQRLEAEISPYSSLYGDEPMDRYYIYLKKCRSARKREEITDLIISASYNILTQKEI